MEESNGWKDFNWLPKGNSGLKAEPTSIARETGLSDIRQVRSSDGERSEA